MTTRRVVVLGAVLALMAACGGGEAQSPPDPVGDEAATTAASSETTTVEEGSGSEETASGGEEEVVLRFPSWQWGQPGYDEFFQEATAAFVEEHPEVAFEQIPVASEEYTDQMVRMFSADDPPEIVQFALWDFEKFASAGWIEPLDDRLADTDINSDTWADYLWEAGQWDGQTHGVYLSGAAQMLFYNQAMFDEAGVEVPTTPEEFLAAAEALTADGQWGYAIPTSADPNMNAYGLNRFVAGLGGGWCVDGQPAATSDEAHQAVELEKALVDSGSVPVGLDRIGARQAFWEGRAAMLIEGPWVMSSILEENPDLMPDVGLASIPFPQQIAGPSNGLALGAGQDHKELAWEFITMTASPEWMEIYGELTGITPAREDALSDDALEDYPWLADFADTATEGVDYRPEGCEVYTRDIDQLVADEVVPVLFEGLAVDEALSAVQGGIEELVGS